ncbi:MAG: hypothetical protein HZA48_07665 [Planctomycetes bacterium]|nr:hypothetical protein [Planctomycetota bacterium]
MENTDFKFASMIGSMPHLDPRRAVELVFNFFPACPCWPQLPRKNVREGMYFQYSENFPGIITDESSGKIWVDEGRFNAQVEVFYSHYLNSDTEYFRIQPDTASGFYAMVDGLKNPPAQLKAVKLQTIGPLTLGLTLTNQAGQSIYYNPEMREALVKNVVMKSLWQLEHLSAVKQRVPAVLLFLDEPYLAAYGSAFTSVSREEIVALLTDAVNEIKKLAAELMRKAGWQFKLLFGTHCCANTDWSILTDSPLNIISFDALGFFDNLALYSGDVKKFTDRGGMLAWGIVPNDDKIHGTTPKELAEDLKKKMDILGRKGIDKRRLTDNFMVTPQCGTGNANEKTAEKTLHTCGEITAIIR